MRASFEGACTTEFNANNRSLAYLSWVAMERVQLIRCTGPVHLLAGSEDRLQWGVCCEGGW